MSTHASGLNFCAFLRAEADAAEDKARRLRIQAAALTQTAGLDIADELAPLDEHGKPKYTGKKRGRKPKPKKRQRKPGTPKRKHTGYTLYMKEHYPSVKMAMAGRVPEAQSKDVISSVATSWKNLSEEDREAWKERARSMTAEEQETADAA
eukprot:CAMPEP_0181063896 /NCGR_PEP_ID=MMETSP1070-20121207/23893_1 /TAXON_ID=265543 /ORGANISM="Minutocellus polymorphus, Strain NH13" /LENGTH=150 /DNA_ID=CAMNT_0023144137 /DNA_START=86 /DNA_END=535 /DNA_ORIENTATION=+